MSIHQEDITILTVYAPDNIVKIHKEKIDKTESRCRNSKLELEISTIFFQ